MQHILTDEEYNDLKSRSISKQDLLNWKYKVEESAKYMVAQLGNRLGHFKNNHTDHEYIQDELRNIVLGFTEVINHNPWTT